MKRRWISLILASMMLLGACGNNTQTAQSTQPTQPTQPSSTTPPTEPTQPWEAELIGSWEAEDGTMSGSVHAEAHAYVTGFEKDGDGCTVVVSVPEDGFYDLEFIIKSAGGKKINSVYVDGALVGEVMVDVAKYQRATVQRVYLAAGDHEVGLFKSWGYIYWDKVSVWTSQPFDEGIFDVSPKLVNENATDNAKRLMSYLCDVYGNSIISGQYCETGMNGWENLMIYNNTGEYPAILGMDMGYYSQTGVDHNVAISTTEQAIAYWEKGGIVTLCWHWLAPEKYITGTWYSAFRPEEVRMNLTKMVNGEDPEGLSLLMKDINNIAMELLEMQEAGVPILWRPLHEASGGWFWWGKEGADTYKKLYVLLYETLTYEYGLNNLIWVWNGQDAAWYPGDEYVDIVGIDIYAGEHVYTSQINSFLETHRSCDSNKMVVLSENGTMIDPELSVRDRAMFGFFCVWGGEFVMNDSIRKSYSEQYTEVEMLKKVYTSEYVITRSELPDLHTYPIRDDAQ